VNHEDLEDIKGASSFATSAWAAKAFAFNASGKDFFEVFVVGSSAGI